MAKGGSKKKSKRGRSSRSKSGKPPAAEPRLDDVLSQAESAMEMSDVDTALKLFGYAASVLRARIGRLDENGSIVDMPMSAGGETRLRLLCLLEINEIKRTMRSWQQS